jgi:hypothetical protein
LDKILEEKIRTEVKTTIDVIKLMKESKLRKEKDKFTATALKKENIS